MRPRSTVGVLVMAAVSALTLACGSEPDPRDVAAAAAPFECEVQAYPCTWDDVAPEVVARTKTLAQLGALYERSGASLQDVVAFLQDQPQVGHVETTGTGVRFRLEDGRPAWIYPGNELDHHRGEPATVAGTGIQRVLDPPASTGTSSQASLLGRVEHWLSPPAHAQEGPAHGVADDEPGTGKRALILAPFEWQYPGHGYITAERAEQIRDYQSAAAGEVSYKADLGEFEQNPSGPHQYVDGDVQFEDFLEWDTYNLVLLLSHGTLHLCHLTAPVGGARRISGEIPDQLDICPLIWAGRAKQESYGAYIGVEIVEYVDPIYEPHPGLTLNEAQYCAQARTAYEAAGNSDAPEPETTGGKPCRVQRGEREGERLALWTDFFAAQYPNGLENAVVMLAACRSAVDDILLDILAPDGNENVSVFGFSNAVDAGEGLGMAAELVRLIGKGIHSHDLEELMGRLDRTGALVGRTLELGDEPATGPAEISDASPTATHGRDIVLLVDPLDGKELRDGGTVSVLAGGPEDTDLLRVYPQLLGVTDAQPGQDARVEVRVVGEGVPNAGYRPMTAVDEYAFRYEKPVALGRRYQEGERVDLEVSIDLPGDGLSRWVYRDIKLVGCYWSADVSGAASASMGGAAMATSYTLAGGVMSNSLNFHHPPTVDAFRLVSDPDTPLTLSIGFPGPLRTGPVDLDHSDLRGRTFPLAQNGNGRVELRVERNQDESPSGAPVGMDSGEWTDAGITRVTGDFSVDFGGIQSYMTAEERQGTVAVTGQFVWTPGCANALDRNRPLPEPEPALWRELREGLLHEDLARSFPTPP